MTEDAARSLLDRAHRSALTAWSELVRPGSVCRFEGPETDRYRAKRMEGAVIALRDARREVRAADATGADVVLIVRKAADEWSSAPGPRDASTRRGREHAAYQEGGNQALARMAEELEAALSQGALAGKES